MGRGIPRNDLIELFLSELAGRGGKLLTTALARNLDVPTFRLSGLLASLQRLFNIEGYAIVALDSDSETVELNVDLLKKQFDLET